ncbi:DUF924 family protein [Rhizobium rhizogenes]
MRAYDFALILFWPPIRAAQRLARLARAKHAEGHRDIIRRFGRFPHRIPKLGRTTTAEEEGYLRSGIPFGSSSCANDDYHPISQGRGLP